MALEWYVGVAGALVICASAVVQHRRVWKDHRAALILESTRFGEPPVEPDDEFAGMAYAMIGVIGFLSLVPSMLEARPFDSDGMWALAIAAWALLMPSWATAVLPQLITRPLSLGDDDGVAFVTGDEGGTWEFLAMPALTLPPLCAIIPVIARPEGIGSWWAPALILTAGLSALAMHLMPPEALEEFDSPDEMRWLVRAWLLVLPGCVVALLGFL